MPPETALPSNQDAPRRALNIYLGRDLKTRWTAYCGRIGKKPGVAIREAVEAQLKKSPALSPAPQPKRQQDEKPDRGGKTRIEIRLTPSEKSAVAELAAAEGCSPQHWIVNALRATIARQPQFGTRELTALGESNYQLLSIGRNLNQIAKHLNEGTPESLTLKDIEKLRADIKRHTALVSKAMRASLERWSIE
ncbi:MAG: plasmid mobilization relaxosome protein MobC [Candidatus Accumulibacter sp.]|nr:plasmid mobilization relaxosome protein MobC [Accumulibacter sp.]